MHFIRLISAIAALAAVSALPNSDRHGIDPLGRSISELEARQPLKGLHGSRRFVDGSTNNKRSFRKHRRGSEEASKKDQSTKRKVRKRSGSCAAKTAATTLSGAASAVASSTAASNYYVSSVTESTSSKWVEATQTASSSSAWESDVQTSSASSSLPPSSTLNLQNAAVHTTTSPSSAAAQTTQMTSVVATSTSSSSSAATTTSTTTWTSVDTAGNGPFSGEVTYYDLGTDGSSIGACGTSLVDSDKIAAAAATLFDSWPGSTGNPNTNPICGQYAKVSSGSASVIVQIQDRCPGCDERHLDLSSSAFLELAELSVGLITDVTWEWVGTSSG